MPRHGERFTVAMRRAVGSKGIVAVQVIQGTVRCRLDGGSPTSTSGFILNAGDLGYLSGVEASQCQMIRDADSSVDGLLAVTYYR